MQFWPLIFKIGALTMCFFYFKHNQMPDNEIGIRNDVNG